MPRKHDVVNATPPARGSEELSVEGRGSLALITLNRPRALNALNIAMRRKLADSYPRFAREPTNYAVVIQSAGCVSRCLAGRMGRIAASG